MSQNKELLSFYITPGTTSDLSKYRPLIDELPREIKPLINTLQQLLLHIFFANQHNVVLSEERQSEVQLRSAAKKLARLLEIDPSPLTAPRPVDKRLICNCRDFSLMLSSILRYKHIPARTRCGFGTYFKSTNNIDYMDHWICEYYDERQNRWITVDPQLDEVQMNFLKISFDPLDVPEGNFITGGKAWQLCRQGKTNPDNFGILEYQGWDFVRGNVVRDFLALNKIEVLPWDFWGLLAENSVRDSTEEELKFIDDLAALSQNIDSNFDKIKTIYQTSDNLKIPDKWSK